MVIHQTYLFFFIVIYFSSFFHWHNCLRDRFDIDSSGGANGCSKDLDEFLVFKFPRDFIK